MQIEHAFHAVRFGPQPSHEETGGFQGAGGRNRGETGPEEDRFELSETARAMLEEQLFGAAKGLPGQGEAGDEVALDEVLSERSAFCPVCGGGHGLDFHANGEDGGGREVRVEGPAAEALAEAGVPEGDATAEGAEDAGAAALPGEGAEDEAGEDEVGRELDEDEQAEVERLQERDREVRTHEQAHVAAGGQYVRGGIQYEYERGPDGKQYAAGGEVQIDTSEIPDDPEATIHKAQVIRRAALAPSEPSGQDRRAAAAASRMESEARQELLKEKQGGGEAGDEEGLKEAGGAEGAKAADEDTEVKVPEPGLAADGGDEGRPDGLPDGKGALDTGPALTPESPFEGGGIDPGGDIGGIEVPEVDPPERIAEGGPSAPAGPPVARLDYGARPEPGQLFDVYR